jgi:NAD(P)-dependent dehydrogenase (short-subunit alcohol dehydrogenase family)
VSKATSLSGKSVVVTGANSGIGFVTSRELAKMGAHVVMVCRSEERAGPARAAVAQVAAGPQPTVMLADLSIQSDVRRLAAELHARLRHVDVLVNNAGASFAKRELTADGVERTIATNYVGPFLLTNLVLDLLKAAPQGRVVTVATEVYPGKLDFANLQGERSYRFFPAYTRSKLADIVFAVELARRLEGTRVTSNALSPGPARTRFGDNMTGAAGLFPRLMKRLPIFKSAEVAARTSILLASAPELARTSGKFFFREREVPLKPVALDRAVAKRLWEETERLCRPPLEVVAR